MLPYNLVVPYGDAETTAVSHNTTILRFETRSETNIFLMMIVFIIIIFIILMCIMRIYIIKNIKQRLPKNAWYNNPAQGVPPRPPQPATVPAVPYPIKSKSFSSGYKSSTSYDTIDSKSIYSSV